ncbi:MAG: thiamine pyrophosphate-dependent dehydrogenase E1 component subunit alpha [Eubacteriales bacterium]|nr:thiamine pyrophosphate-dependent dehydrogenase E1 component subunit alpha [Eubacteriales bacterium]
MKNSYNLSAEALLELYKTMKRIRMTEEKIAAHYREDNMHTPVHLYIGQEAIAAGVCANLSKDDKLFSNHRNHGHYLAKGGNLKAMIAELHNKETGCSKGYGGSMHLVDNNVGFPITSSIVAGGVPIGTGDALAASTLGEGRVTVVFMGDAATEEGVVYESLCFAVLKNLPVVYICENNLYSVGTHLLKREKEQRVSKKFEGILPVYTVDGNDVLAVYESSRKAIEHARYGRGPSFIEYVTYRLRDHHDTKTGVEAGYQSQEEWDSWKEKCPIAAFERILSKENLIDTDIISGIEETNKNELNDAFRFAEESRLPDVGNLYNGLFG